MTNPDGCREFYANFTVAALALAVHHPVAGFDVDRKTKV